MRLRVTYNRADAPVDLEVGVDGTATIKDLATALVRQDPAQPYAVGSDVTIAIDRGGDLTELPADATVADARIASGDVIRVVSASPTTSLPPVQAAATLRVIAGPERGQQFPLHEGSNYIGRGPGMDVRLSDPLVSSSHAKVNIGASAEIIDNSSSNGVLIGGALVSRAPVRSRDEVTLGDTVVVIEVAPSRETAPDRRPDNEFVRPPRVLPRFDEESHIAPELPRRSDPQRFPLIALLTPVLLAAVLYAVTRQAATLLFVLLSPVMLVGQWMEARWSGRRQYREAVAAFDDDVSALCDLVRERQSAEAAVRCDENPSLADLQVALEKRSPLLWSRRPAENDFLALRLGLGTRPSRVQIELPTGRPADTVLWERLRTRAESVSHLDGVPVLAALQSCGSLGVAGAGEEGAAVARSLVLQAALLHSPAELTIAGALGSATADRWGWLPWLPHSQGTHGPLNVDLVSATPGGTTALVSAVEALVEIRAEVGEDDPLALLPAILLVVEDDCSVDRARLVELAERGRSAAVHVLWVAPTSDRLPAACRVFLHGSGATGWKAAYADDAEVVAPVVVEPIALPDAMAAARALAPLVDAGARLDTIGDLPASVPFVVLAGSEFAREPQAIIERWIEADSFVTRRDPNRRRSAGSLRALVGQASAAPLMLDLRTDGPHALVGGTTGAGKSELLQTWVLGMAAAHSPERVTFLFVDYKGGSAFGECVDLPHSVGLVTDLSPHLVRRALTSLNAELRHREHLLNAAKAKDLAAMERAGHPATPPSLVIVVDEFAALAQDMPDFVDGMVNIAQRGRSLGLHLILATQRPSGVIKDNLRANTNLRIALRMADEADSTDILGKPDAASFDAAAPGRAAVKIGSSRLVPFQSGYVGGSTPDEPPPPAVELREFSLTGSKPWVEPEPLLTTTAPSEANDLQRIVATIRTAASLAEVAQPRRPWLPELPDVVDLADLTTDRSDDRLVIGVLDSPEDQAQPTFAFEPDRDGNLAVFGTGASGKSTTLRSLAVAAALSVRGGPVEVYALDFGARGLQMLEQLPHVGSVVPGDDSERVHRLLRHVRDLVDERAPRYAAVQAANIKDYRARAGSSVEPRVLLLLDGLAAFRQQYDIGSMTGMFELLTSIAADGRPVGVHVVLTADRAATMPSSLGSLVPRRLVLRTADDNDLAMLGVPADLFELDSPPGRGFIDEREAQVAVLSGSRSVADQADAIHRLAGAMARNAHAAPAQEIRRLPTHVPLAELPVRVGTLPVLGLEDSGLTPIGMPVDGTFVIAGPPASGRTTALRTAIASRRRMQPDVELVLLAPGRSALADELPWYALAQDPDDAAELAERMQDVLRTSSPRQWVVVLENPADMLNGPADLPLQDLVKTARSTGQLVLAEGDTQSLSGSWGLVSAVRYSRRGLVLQPDQTDGDTLFRTTFPRVRRADFPLGRGLLVGEGRSARVQVAVT